VTQLKSTTWPAGTAIGDVVDIQGDTIPESLAGKCVAVQAAAPAAAPAKAAEPVADAKPAAKSKR